MAHHSNLVAAVVPGLLTCRLNDGTSFQAAVGNGLVRVEHNDVLLLADTLERPEEIDENRARRAAEEAKEAMLQQRSQQEYLQAQADLSRALSRLKAASLRNKTI
jgi:F-type H+-transporting ATPase subunit epsilon